MTAEGSDKNMPPPVAVLGDDELPLFPLGMWLYPGVTFPLQIFEPRYLSMISERLKQGAGFGIVPIQNGREVGKVPRIYPAGVNVEVVDWYQQSNGLLGIKVRGNRRIRVLDTETRDDNLLVGQVAYLPEEMTEPLLERHNGLLELLRELKQHPHSEALDLDEPDSALALSYQLAQLLPFDANKKMTMLMTADPEARLALIAQQVFDLANA